VEGPENKSLSKKAIPKTRNFIPKQARFSCYTYQAQIVFRLHRTTSQKPILSTAEVSGGKNEELV
jgi:hypothetical protein